MCVDSFARCALAGMDALAARLEHGRDRMLREPVDLEVGVQLAQLVGDRRVALRVAEADRRGDVERALAARLAAHPARRRGGGAMNSRRSRLTLTGSRTCGPWPEPSSMTSSPPVASASAMPRPGPVIASSVPWITSTGQRTRPASSRCRVGVERLARACRRDQRLGRRLEPPADAVLDRLRRVRLREHLREEELEEAAVVAQPVVAVVLRPALVGVELLGPAVLAALAAGPRRAATAGQMKTAPSTRSGMLGREQERPLRAQRERDEHGAAPSRSRP